MEPFKPDKFPLKTNHWNWPALTKRVSASSSALSFYNGILSSIINPGVFLSPLETKEAVLSSKIEGTVTTIDEVLKYEVDLKPEDVNKERDIAEVLNYRSAMRKARDWLSDGMPFNVSLIKAIHGELMTGVRGKDKQPGKLRSEQNWIGSLNCSLDQASYIPPEPLSVPHYLEELIQYVNSYDDEVLIQCAILHAQFEIIHPFLDGNGRTGRILIPLFLWFKNRIMTPSFYISEYFEEHREAYLHNLLMISQNQAWENWISFFLEAIEVQAQKNADKAQAVLNLYGELKEKIPDISQSPNLIKVIDLMFVMPVFRSTDLIEQVGLNRQTAYRLINRLKDEKILRSIRPASGRTPEILVFWKLHKLLEE